MKLGILYTICGSMALVGSIEGIRLTIIGIEPHSITTFAEIFFGILIGLWLLPEGLHRIRETIYEWKAKHEN